MRVDNEDGIFDEDRIPGRDMRLAVTFLLPILWKDFSSWETQGINWINSGRRDLGVIMELKSKLLEAG